MRSVQVLAAAAAMSAVFAFQSHAALVGTLSQPGESLTVPLAFDGAVFNSAIDVDKGLSFAIAPGLHGPVTLEVIQGTKNVKVAAAAIGQAFGISQSLPLSITSEDLAAGVHQFAIGVVASGAPGSAVISRLTLTPIPGSLILLAPAVAALGWNFARRRPNETDASAA